MRIGRVVVVERGGVLTLGQCVAFTDEEMTVRFAPVGSLIDDSATGEIPTLTYTKGQVHKIRDPKVEELVRQVVGVPLDVPAPNPAEDEQESSTDNEFEWSSPLDDETEPLEEDAEEEEQP